MGLTFSFRFEKIPFQNEMVYALIKAGAKNSNLVNPFTILSPG
jgi:hypothetical protein